VHVHALGDEDLATEEALVVEWSGGHGSTYHPEMVDYFIETLGAELFG